jgi:tRNA wybutosine-synthesizing protein 2
MESQVNKISSSHRKRYYQFLQTRLKDQIPPELLPRRIRILGHVAILWLNPQIVKHKTLIGKTTLEYSSKIRSVIRRTDAIAGPYRQPAVELIAGSHETETDFQENKVVFHIDPMKVMFSVGNKAERLRMSQLGSDEFVIDMFAGIGQLSLPMAVHAKPRVIHAIEWNPNAYHYLQQNILANKVSEIFIPHFGDTRLITPSVGKADRIIMGLIQGTDLYLEQGVKRLRSGGIMHIHEIGPKEEMETELLTKLKKVAASTARRVELINTRVIKTYSPRYSHFAIDVQLFDK